MKVKSDALEENLQTRPKNIPTSWQNRMALRVTRVGSAWPGWIAAIGMIDGDWGWRRHLAIKVRLTSEHEQGESTRTLYKRRHTKYEPSA